MSEVKRYEMNHKGLPEEDGNGSFMLYEDYAALLKERDALAVDNSVLKSSIANTQGAIELASSAVNDDRRGDVFRDILTAIYTKTAVETQATDAAIANIQAQGVDRLADHLSGLNVMASETSVREFASQLRKETGNE